MGVQVHDLVVGDVGHALELVARKNGQPVVWSSTPTLTATLVHSSGYKVPYVVDTMFNVTSQATGEYTWAPSDPDMFPRAGSWRFRLHVEVGSQEYDCDEVELRLGPPIADPPSEYDQETTAGTIFRDGFKMYGEGFLVVVLSTGIYLVSFLTKLRAQTSAAKLSTERAMVFKANVISADGGSASMEWASPNSAVIYIRDVNDVAANRDVSFYAMDSAA